MITTVKQAQVKVADYVELITNRQTILAHGNGPQLTEPYCIVKEVSIVGVQHDTSKREYDDQTDIVTETVRGLGKFTYMIEAWGKDAGNVLNKLKASFWSAIFMDKLMVEGFGLSEIGEVTDTSAPLISANWESRAQLSVSFYVSVSAQFVIDHFNKVKVLVEEDEKQYSNELDIDPDSVIPCP